MFPHNCTIRKSKRAKNIILSVTKEKGVEVVIPQRVAKWQALAFLNANQAWVQNRLEKISKEIAQPLPEILDLKAINEQWSLLYFDYTSTKLITKIESKSIHIYHSNNEQKQIRQLLKRWLIKKAQNHLPLWLTNISTELGLPYNKLSIRAQTSLWGSCNRKMNISLNSKLLFMEPEVVRMIMIHELLHTKHFNHSKRFWTELAIHIPNHRKLKKILTMHALPI